MKTPVFKDRVKLYIESGAGGDGSASFRREKYEPHGGPDGGDAGRGGHVYFQADPNENSLLTLYFKPHHRAKPGQNGSKKRCHGKNGPDIYIKVPCGTVVHDAKTGEKITEILNEGDIYLIASGGAGGIGNCHFKTSTHQAPQEFTTGEPGESKVLFLELKTIAEVGLVGYPNAGKSTLVSAITNAHPKVAAYPFTTLNPVVGTLEYEDYNRLRVADIPGLVDGAHEGVGLGHDFLRHIERTKYLLYVIDMAAIDGRKPYEDYKNLRSELKHHNVELDDLPYAIIANKMDLADAKDNLAEFRKEIGEEPICISALDKDGLNKVYELLYDYFFKRKQDQVENNIES